VEKCRDKRSISLFTKMFGSEKLTRTGYNLQADKDNCGRWLLSKEVLVEAIW
jgi:hypothetical protein